MKSRLPTRLLRLTPGTACVRSSSSDQQRRPEALFITCSDSALDDSLVRRLRSHAVLLLRTEGNTVPTHSDASADLLEALDIALHHWSVPQIIICGHSGCRAIRMAVEGSVPERTPDDRGDTSPTWFDSMQHRIARAAAVNASANQHVLQQLELLRSYPTVRPRVADGQLDLSGWMYLHESGVIPEYDDGQEAFQPLTRQFTSG